MWIVLKTNKQIHTKKGAIWSTLLEITHTNICRPFDASSFNKENFFLTFIDDFSYYGYLHLLHENYETINALEIFINEVKR